MPVKTEYKLIKGNEGIEEITSFRQTSECFPAYEINPALGCDFGCTYCSMYAQESEMNHMPVRIFSDYPQYLNDMIRGKGGGEGLVFNFTPKSDVFMPSLTGSGMTQEILDVLTKSRSRFYLITKGGVPPEDVQKRLYDARDLGQVIISAGLPDEDYRRKLEPEAPDMAQRIELGRFCRDSGIRASGIVAPFLPEVSGDYKECVIDRYSSAGIDHLSIHILKVSKPCLDRMCRQLGHQMMAFYTESEKHDWTLPGKKKVDRFYANSAIMRDELLGFKALAEERGMSVSVCTKVKNDIIHEPGFNDNAGNRGITCVGFRK